MLSRWSSVHYGPPPTSHPASSWISPLRLIPFVTVDVGHRPDEISPVPSSTFANIPFSLRRRVLRGCNIQVLRRFPWPSLSATAWLPLLPFPGTFFDAARFTLSCGLLLCSPSQGDTTLLHSQSSGCTGCLLRGHLSVTTTGLPPVSTR